MLAPEMEQLYGLLAELKEHEHRASLVVEDEDGRRLSVLKAFTVGTRTDDPGLVIRLTADLT
jgi:hypothetical protein